MLERLLPRRRRTTPEDNMPAIVFPGDGHEWWVGQMHELGRAGLAVELTFVDGSTRNASLRAAGFYGPQQLAGITAILWDGDEEPPRGALQTVVYSTDITRIRIY